MNPYKKKLRKMKGLSSLSLVIQCLHMEVFSLPLLLPPNFLHLLIMCLLSYISISYNFWGKIIRSNWLSLGVSTYSICMGLYRLITPIGIMYSILLETVNIEFFSFIAVTESYGGMCMCLQDGGGSACVPVCICINANGILALMLKIFPSHFNHQNLVYN